jgi:hypothetical protein
MKITVVFTVVVDAEDKDQAYTLAVDSVEGFPPPGVEVQCRVDGKEYTRGVYP